MIRKKIPEELLSLSEQEKALFAGHDKMIIVRQKEFFLLMTEEKFKDEWEKVKSDRRGGELRRITRVIFGSYVCSADIVQGQIVIPPELRRQ